MSLLAIKWDRVAVSLMLDMIVNGPLELDQAASTWPLGDMGAKDLFCKDVMQSHDACPPAQSLMS